MKIMESVKKPVYTEMKPVRVANTQEKKQRA